MARTKLTAFSRLLIFLLVFLPLAYIGASYYNGEDPIGNIKGWLGMNDTAPATTSTTTAPAPTQNTPPAPASNSSGATFEEVKDLRSRNADLLNRLSAAEEELRRCQAGGGQ